MENKKLLFSVTKDDCEWQYFRSGGKGGQNQNKVNSGARCIHHPSGARGEARDSRDQLTNRRSAFLRMTNTKEFEVWHKLECARRLGKKSVDELVDQMMAEENILIEGCDGGTWFVIKVPAPEEK